MLIRTEKSQMRFSRRNLMKALGVGLAMLPMIESDPADAAECYVGGIKRLFVFAWANGMLSNVSTWATAGTTPSAWKVASFQSVPPSGNSLLPGMPVKSLADYQSDLILLHGLDYDFITDQPNPNGGETNGHACFPGMLTGSNYQSLVKATSDDLGGAISIDQYIANKMVMAGYEGIPSLSLGTFVNSTGALSWKGSGQVVQPSTNPFSVFSTYFAGKLPTNYGTDAGPAAPPPAADAGAYSSGKSILDYVLADLNRFQNIVGSADKVTIQNHMQSVRTMEKTLQGYGTGGGTMDAGTISAAATGCGTAAVAATTAVGIKTENSNAYLGNTANIPTLLKLNFDMAAAAFAADMTRVVVCQCGDQGDANLILTWLGFVSGGPNTGDPNTGDENGYHSIAHRNDADKTTCDTWFQQQIAYMIGNMKSVTDMTGASILDNSLFLAMNNMRTGTHETTAVPVVMAGSLGGYFKTGQSLALTGVNNNRLLLSILAGFGYPQSTFGTASYCSGGPLTQLNA